MREIASSVGLGGMPYLNVVLKILAVLVGLMVAVLIVAKAYGFGIGIRVTQGVFSEHIAGMTVVSWLLILAILIEFLILASLFILPRASSP